MIISRSVPLRIKNASDANCRQKLKHTMFNNAFSRKSCRLWDVEKCGTAIQAKDDYNKVHQFVRVCRITMATDTHSKYVTLVAFPRQQWIGERFSMSRIRTMPVLYKLQHVHTRLVGFSWNLHEHNSKVVLASEVFKRGSGQFHF
jgi:hypothetical protein